MQFFDNIRSSKFFSLGLFLPQFVILGIYFHKLYLKFLSFCPNQNFLTWDPDARLITSIRFAEAVRSFDLWTVVKLTFDSPTWPVLRNFPEAMIVLWLGPGGTPVSLFTFGELILLFLIVPWILFRFSKSKSWVVPSILFPLVWAGLLQNPGFMHYSFSGMLEIQGALFFLPAILSFWELQKYFSEKEKFLDPSHNSNSFLTKDTKRDNSQSRSEEFHTTAAYSPWFLCISVNLLFHTKYPYGYIFIFFGGLFLIIFRLDETKRFIFKILNFYGLYSKDNFGLQGKSNPNDFDLSAENPLDPKNLSSSKKNNLEQKKSIFLERDFFRRIQWAALIPIGISVLLIFVSLILSKEVLPGKTKAFLRYAGVLIFWISISVTLWKIFYVRKENIGKDPNLFSFDQDKEIDTPFVAGSSAHNGSSSYENLFVWKYFWTYVILPIGSWVLLHPDRFSSSSSTIQHAQGAGLMPGQGDDSIFSLTYFQEISENSFYAPYGGWVLCGGLILGIVFGIFRYQKDRKVRASYFLFLSVFVSILGLTLMTPNHQPRHIYHLYPALLIAVGIFCYEEFSSKTFRPLSLLIYSIFLMFTLGYWNWKHFDIWEKTNLCFSDVDRSLFFTAEDAEGVFFKTVNRSSVLWNMLPLENHNRPDITLSFYRAGFINHQEVREKRKKEEFDFEKNSQSKEDWFIIAKSCEEVEGGSIETSSNEFKFAKNVTQLPIRGACILKIEKR
ncbi:hypothetical protein [Leptospira alstonii]|uniref:hypothetical protein n=1 Tax=Leptospira alstonii TaxID=28452 RepID=UPI000773A594|nr:hypothetical protein [Leptospira alstonii]